MEWGADLPGARSEFFLSQSVGVFSQEWKGNCVISPAARSRVLKIRASVFSVTP